MNTEDMCIDYQLKFRIKFNKLDQGDLNLGIFLCQKQFWNYFRPFKERYIYICLIKWNVSIGFMV